MLKYTSFLISAVVFCCSEAAFVDTLPKCTLKDQDCLKDLYGTIVRDIGSTGVPELGIPAVDPIELQNVTVSVLGVVDITLVKGVATGVSGCVFDIFKVDLKKGSGYQENTCSITIEGEYIINSNAIIKSVFGGNAIHGKGHGKAIIDKLHLSFDFPAYAQKRDDGETYINVDYKNIKYDYEIRGGSKFAADNIYLGDLETSKTIIPFLNQNEKFVMKNFGKAFIDKATEFYFEYAGKFFDVVPTKNYLTDDLSSFAKP